MRSTVIAASRIPRFAGSANASCSFEWRDLLDCASPRPAIDAAFESGRRPPNFGSGVPAASSINGTGGFRLPRVRPFPLVPAVPRTAAPRAESSFFMAAPLEFSYIPSSMSGRVPLKKTSQTNQRGSNASRPRLDAPDRVRRVGRANNGARRKLDANMIRKGYL